MDKDRIIEIVTGLYYVGIERGSEWGVDFIREVIKQGANVDALEAWKAQRSSTDKDADMEVITNAISRIFEAAQQTAN